VPSAYFGNLYFDTLVYDLEFLEFLMRKVGAEHVLLGTDFPYALGDWQCVDKVEQLPCSETDKRLILEGNARALLRVDVN
jgi:aminocarboxymuconate-semialdehyde decarboxylase